MTKLQSQRGAVLLIGLIMLVLLTLFAISALNTGITGLKMVGNMQARSEATNAAQAAIETVISTPLFATNPSNAVVNPCGAPNTLCIDKNGASVTNSGSAYYVTKLVKTTSSAVKPTPACVAVTPKKITELDLSKPDDLSCAAGQGQQFGVQGAVTGDSLCAESVWEITAQTTATASGATATVTQGIGIRISTDDMATSCL